MQLLLIRKIPTIRRLRQRPIRITGIRHHRFITTPAMAIRIMATVIHGTVIGRLSPSVIILTITVIPTIHSVASGIGTILRHFAAQLGSTADLIASPRTVVDFERWQAHVHL